MFDKITIIGCGLIGSSLMRVIDKKKLSKKISLFDKSKEVSTFIKNNFSAQVFNNISNLIFFSILANLRKKKIEWKVVQVFYF